MFWLPGLRERPHHKSPLSKGRMKPPWQIQLREAYLHLHRLRLLAKGNNRDSKARNNCGPAFSRSKQHVQMDPPIAKICEDKLARLFGRARVPLWCRYAGKSQSSRAARIEPAAH